MKGKSTFKTTSSFIMVTILLLKLQFYKLELRGRTWCSPAVSCRPGLGVTPRTSETRTRPLLLATFAQPTGGNPDTRRSVIPF